MKNITFPGINLSGRNAIHHVRLIHNQPETIVVAAAARTPWGKYQGQLASLNGLQLGQAAVEAAVKRSAIPLEQIHYIFMNETTKLQEENENEFIFTNFLKKSKYIPITIEEEKSIMKNFLKALEFIKSEPQAAAVAGGFMSATNNGSNTNKEMENTLDDEVNEITWDVKNNYIQKCLTKYKQFQTEAIFDSEIVPLKVHTQRANNRIIEEIINDEISNKNFGNPKRPFQICDGAAAVVLTTLRNAQELKLSPLAAIKNFEYSNRITNNLASISQSLQKLLTKVKLKPEQIKHWEIDDTLPQVIPFLEKQFQLNADFINPHGGCVIFGDSPSTSFACLLTHLTHALNPLEYGCIIASNYQELLVMIVQKLPYASSPHHLPLVTLYTKDPCPLCDMLVEELELNFSGEYELEKVFIDNKDNLRFLRLYRYDIPVVFLNNQFLCMHRLNHRLLRKQLNLLKNINL